MSVLAAVLPAPGAPVELREFPRPALEPDSALLRVECSEVCGTDVHLQEGRLSGVPYPLIPGHVTAGVLEEVRGTVRDIHGRQLAAGERVTFFDVHATCNACWYCLVARAGTRCPQRRVYGITYGAEDGLAGGWAEYVYLRPGTRVLPLGALSAADFLAGGCGLPTALHAVERAGLQIGEDVLILGTGPVGLSAIALARLRGAGSVLAIGAPEARLQTALAMGASAVFDFSGSDENARREWVLEHTGGRGADVVLEAAGDPAAVVDAMGLVRDAGRVVVAGQYTDRGEARFSPHRHLNAKHLDVRGCWGSEFVHFYRAVQVLAHPSLSAPWRAMPRRGFSLRDAGRALQAVAAGEVVKALVKPPAFAESSAVD